MGPKEWLRTEAARLGPGQRLPSTRWLIQTHRMSQLTVSRALTELGREGVVVSRPGASDLGAPCAAPMRMLSDSLRSLCDSQRVTFDLGTFRVTSPPGGPTHVEAVIPCAR